MNPLFDVNSGESAAVPFRAGDELMQALAPSGQKRGVQRGDRLLSFGDEAKGVYLIMGGTARVSVAGDSGKELVCHLAGPGSVLGLPAALCSSRYEFDVDAVEPLDALFLETGRMNEILRDHPALCMQAMTMMCDEMSHLRKTSDHMRNCTNDSCSLHEQCRKCG